MKSEIHGLYVIADRAEKLKAAFAAGAKLGQLRCKDLDPKTLRFEAQSAKNAADEFCANLIINDDLRLAEDLGAFGVHLGQEDLLKYTREELSLRKIKLGISTHSYQELAIAKSYHPEYVAFGPIFHTTCKSMRFGPQGLERLQEWRKYFAGPLVAIGGLTPETAALALAGGADSVAVISDVFNHAEHGIAERVKKWLEVISAYKYPCDNSAAIQA